MKTSDLRRWATVGAQQRLVEIDIEQKAIFAAFPELREGRRNPNSKASRAESNSPAPKRRRRRMSREARKRISDAQKARWAKQRAATKK